MTEPTVLEALITALRAATSFNANDQVGPVAILWPDKERLWGDAMAKLRDSFDVLTLGDYDPRPRIGPSYWIRCMLARAIEEDLLDPDVVPVIYLPGYARDDLRAVEECPKQVQALAELQHRSVWWTQPNGKDWTILAFLKNTELGLGLELKTDQATISALSRAAVKLMDEPVERLRRRGVIQAEDLDELLNPNAEKSILLWLDEPERFKDSNDLPSWEAFCGNCRNKFGFDPEVDGPLRAAEMLGGRSGPWSEVWERFTDNPRPYANIPEGLRRARPATLMVSYDEAWPQDNEEAEAALRQELISLGDRHPGEARKRIAELWADHGPRVDWVWSQLGKAPLAKALEHLSRLAGSTDGLPVADSVKFLADWYAEEGWKVDDSALRALASTETADDVNAVKSVLRGIYRPWLDSCARTFQSSVADGSISAYPRAGLPPTSPGTCILFSDALRLDLAKRLTFKLEKEGVEVDLDWALAALPTVTPCAKPAISPIADALFAGADLGASKSEGGPTLDAASFRTILASKGFQALSGDEVGDPSGKGWTELGDIDSYGHNHESKLAHHAEQELRHLSDRVRSLVDAGWERVVVVTDHGWLLVPGDLPKAELPEHLTKTRKGRCARLKEGAVVDHQTIEWSWDAQVRFAIAPGISSFVAGKEYDHGGVSLQECVVPVMTCSRTKTSGQVKIDSHTWVGLRCRIQLVGELDGCTVDIRDKPAVATSSVVTEPKMPDGEGMASVLVEDDGREGEVAMIVVEVGGQIVAQAPTTIGGS